MSLPERIGLAIVSGAFLGAVKWLWDARAADVVIRCENDDCNTQHGLSEPWAKWFHCEALVRRPLVPRPGIVKDAEVSVFVRHSSQVIDEEWRWFGGKEKVTLSDRATLVPLVVGNVTDIDQTLGLGWLIPAHRWFKTPTGQDVLGGELTPAPQPGDRWAFEVVVRWSQGRHKHLCEAFFELAFPKSGGAPRMRVRPTVPER